MTVIVTDAPPSPPSPYFTASYGRASALATGGTWLSLSGHDGAWQMPLVLTPNPAGGVDAASPYGYAGIRIDPGLEGRDVRECWRLSRELLRERDVTSVFLRFAPYDPYSMKAARDLAPLEVVELGQTIEVPTRDADAVWTGMEGRSRTAIRKAERLGLVVVSSPLTVERVAAGSAFRALYDKTMERRDAASHLRFTDAYYGLLLEDAADSLVVEVRKDGEPVAAAIVLADEKRLHYHLSGSTAEGARAGANNLLLWHILGEAVGNGRDAVHLGGGLRADDSLLAFKRSFGGSLLPFAVGRLVVDPERYDDLVRHHASEAGTTVERLLATGYFPAYRAEVT